MENVTPIRKDEVDPFGDLAFVVEAFWDQKWHTRAAFSSLFLAMDFVKKYPPEMVRVREIVG